MQTASFFFQWPPMALTDASFLFVFLPLGLFCYYAVGHRARPGVLLLLSLLYLGLAQPQGVPLLLGSVLLDYLFVCVMARGGRSVRRLCVGVSLLKNLFVVWAGFSLVPGGAPLVLGAVVSSALSFDALLSFYREEHPYEENLVSFALHALFFPRLYAGPVQPYREFAGQLSQLHLQPKRLWLGLGQYVQGGLKLVLFGRQFATLFETLRAIPEGEGSVLSCWSVVLMFALAAYYTLSGYCDMAQGIGVMFGIFLPRNFYYPYQSRSVGDFFERFHMTGAALLRRCLGVSPERKRGALADSLLLLLTGALLGPWFGPRVNYALWGVFLMLFVVVERHLLLRAGISLPTLFSRMFTFVIVLLGFAVMAGQSAGESLLLLRRMLGLESLPRTDGFTLYLLQVNIPLLLPAAFFCTNTLNLLMLWMHKNMPRLAGALASIAYLSLLVLYSAVAL